MTLNLKKESTKDMINKIVLTNEKGGTGKSTITCLLVEYLNFLNRPVQLVDTDPIQSSQDWVNNCLEVGRKVSHLNPHYQIVDTAGSSGSALSHLKTANWIVVPFQPHYVDLKVTIDWYDSLKSEWKEKIIFIPNRWQNTKEQRDGLLQLTEIVKESNLSKIISPLSNRPAFYGAFLGGSANNFFSQKRLPLDVKSLMEELIEIIK